MTKIILDAGHGLQTRGKRVPDGSMREYEFNSAVARHARDLLLQYQDVQVKFTHTDARDVPLKDRCDVANQWGADVFVSIHANAHGRNRFTSANGIETYSHDTGTNSHELAKAVQRCLTEATGLRDRGVKTADFKVLCGTTMPAILTENGFMTNRAEAELLKSEPFRKKVAKATVKGLVEHVGLVKSAPRTDCVTVDGVRVPSEVIGGSMYVKLRTLEDAGLVAIDTGDWPKVLVSKP